MKESEVNTNRASGNLGGSMARAIAWNAAAKWTTQIVTWASTIVVARLLTPYDYGLVGMAGLYLALATLIGQVGIGDAIVALRDLTDRQIAELNTVSLIIGVGLVGISCLLAHPLARFFSSPPLSAVVVVASATYVCGAPQIVPRALLQKEFRFRLLASIEMGRAFCQVIVTLVLVWLRFGYWSLILGTVAGAAAATILTLFWKRHPFSMPRPGTLRRELKFSVHVMLTGISWYIYDNADFGVAGRVLGDIPLGNYTVAWTIASAPVERIANLVTNVTPAYFSALQHSSEELRRYFLRLTEILSLVTIPASIGLALTADYLLPVVLGPKWYAAIGPLRLLGIFVAFRSLTTILPSLLTAVGEARFVMWATVATTIIMPLAFYFGSRWGTNGIAAAWVIAYPPIMVPMFWRVLKRTKTTVRDYLHTIMPASSASILMAVAVLLLRLILPQRVHSTVDLGVLIGVGALSYSGALLLFHYQRVLRMMNIIRNARNRTEQNRGDALSEYECAAKDTPVV